ncbi:MAG: rhamnogalacturonan acetylesterase [Flavisolibacter sp.]|jgi:lysophospholipase L1-like esterase
MKFVRYLFAWIILVSFTLPAEKIKVWLIGDSTIANKEVKAYPETGWGMPFRYMFDSTVEVDNRAKNGRSTKSFIAEGLWKPVMDEMKAGDYVFIQFGHNDEGKEKVGRYTTPDEFKKNLETYISDTRSKKGIPVLITPVARRTFDSSGKIKESHPVYADAVREVAKKLGVPLIDLDAESMALLQGFGPETSKLLFNYVMPGEHPNYPDGKKDDTHFSELGARKMAGIVLADIKKLDLELKNHIVHPIVK